MFESSPPSTLHTHQPYINYSESGVLGVLAHHAQHLVTRNTTSVPIRRGEDDIVMEGGGGEEGVEQQEAAEGSEPELPPTSQQEGPQTISENNQKDKSLKAAGKAHLLEEVEEDLLADRGRERERGWMDIMRNLKERWRGRGEEG